MLDRYFGNVCELDLIFNFHKAYYVLDELLVAGVCIEWGQGGGSASERPWLARAWRDGWKEGVAVERRCLQLRQAGENARPDATHLHARTAHTAHAPYPSPAHTPLIQLYTPCSPCVPQPPGELQEPNKKAISKAIGDQVCGGGEGDAPYCTIRTRVGKVFGADEPASHSRQVNGWAGLRRGGAARGGEGTQLA